MTTIPTKSEADETLSAWRKATRWREESAGDIFPTQSSADWFFRNHHAELVASGALIPGTGRRGNLVGPGIDGVVISILRREAGRSGGNHEF